MHFSSSEETGKVVMMVGLKRDNGRKRFEMQNQQAAFAHCLCCAEAGGRVQGQGTRRYRSSRGAQEGLRGQTEGVTWDTPAEPGSFLFLQGLVGSVTYGLGPEFSPTPISVNEVLSEYSHARMFPCVAGP